MNKDALRFEPDRSTTKAVYERMRALGWDYKGVPWKAFHAKAIADFEASEERRNGKQVEEASD